MIFCIFMQYGGARALYTLFVYKCFFSALDIFVAISAILCAAPIVGVAI